jgi:hypothetical protein
VLLDGRDHLKATRISHVSMTTVQWRQGTLFQPDALILRACRPNHGSLPRAPRLQLRLVRTVLARPREGSGFGRQLRRALKSVPRCHSDAGNMSRGQQLSGDQMH